MGREAKAMRRRGRIGMIGRVGLIGFVLLFAGLLGWWGWRHLLRLSYFQIAQVVVEGNLQLSSEEIVARLQIPPRLSLLEIDLKELSRRLAQDPWIKEAYLRRRIPFTLIVQVVERVPEAVLVGDKPYLLSADGVILARATDDEALFLPVLKAPAERRYAIGERVLSTEVARGLAIWREFQSANAVGWEQAREIVLERDGSYTVRLGPSMPFIRLKAEDMEGQLRRLVQVLAFTNSDLTQYEYVDLRFGQKVIVKPRGGEVDQGKRADRRA